MKKFKSFVRSKDMFGHTINLNFNKQGYTHQTFVGGFFSFIIKIAMGTYIFMNFKKLLFYEDDSLNEEIQKLDLDQLEELPYK